MYELMVLQTPLRLNIGTVVAKIIITHLIASVISVREGDMPSTIITSKRNARLHTQRGLPIFGLRHFDHLMIISANFRILNLSVNWLVVSTRKTSLRKALLRNLVSKLLVLRFQNLYSLLHLFNQLLKFFLTVMFWYIAPN